jgi:hypothetical protein
MTKAVKIISLIALLSGVLTSVQAQDFKNAIGARFSTYGAFGASLKHFTNDNTALEVNATFRSYSYSYLYSYTYTYIDISGLYEKYENLKDVPNLKWYYGGGPVVGLYNYGDGYYGTDATFRLGLAGVVGLSYKFPNSPFEVSADYLPSFNFLGGSYFNANRGGLAVRYTF